MKAISDKLLFESDGAVESETAGCPPKQPFNGRKEGIDFAVLYKLPIVES